MIGYGDTLREVTIAMNNHTPLKNSIHRWRRQASQRVGGHQEEGFAALGDANHLSAGREQSKLHLQHSKQAQDATWKSSCGAACNAASTSTTLDEGKSHPSAATHEADRRQKTRRGEAATRGSSPTTKASHAVS